MSLTTDFETSYAISFSESVANFYPVNVYAPVYSLISIDASQRMFKVAKLCCSCCDVHVKRTMLKKMNVQNESDTFLYH